MGCLDGCRCNIFSSKQKEFSPFYGISIKVHVKFPENYPFSKPEIKLDNYKIFFHANISANDGKICHKIVQSDQMIGIR